MSLNNDVDNLEHTLYHGLLILKYVSLLFVKDRMGMGDAFLRLDGKTPPNKVASIIGDEEKKEGFQGDPTKKVILVGLLSGGTGINLQQAQFGVLLDLWWNPSVERQAIDRVHRVRSPHRDNYFFKFCAEGTAEGGVVLDTQVKKIELVEDTTDTGAEMEAQSILEDGRIDGGGGDAGGEAKE